MIDDKMRKILRNDNIKFETMISQKEEGKKDSTSEKSTRGFIFICNALLLKLVDGYIGGHSVTL